VVENHKLYFDVAHILSVVLGFSSTKHGITCNLDSCFQ